MQTAPRRFACTALSHATSKASPHAFARDTEPRGLMPDGDGGTLVLGNCKLCHTTLSIPANAGAVLEGAARAEPFCACGRILSRCDGSRRGCRSPDRGRL